MPNKLKLIKPSAEYKALYDADSLYPLHSIALVTCEGKIYRCHIEDLRGSWTRPDPVWEIRAPAGYHFKYDDTHGSLEGSLSDCHDYLRGVLFEDCADDDYSCGNCPDGIKKELELEKKLEVL